MEQYDSRVDAYIAKSAAFSQPVLEYLRQLVHDTSPVITENIKWGFPFFEYKGVVCYMAAFKQHCSFGFWKTSGLNDPTGSLQIDDGKAGNFGPITSIADLPPKEILADFILQVIARNGQMMGVPVKKAPAKEKTELVIPDYFIDFLADDPKAKEVFDKFSYSHKKEYAQWVLDAKTDATRLKRMETAREWLREGKSRNWKYQ